MAAGLGFKTFTTGEVLTAADTNGYLMQGVLVFASAAARDAAITSPQEGQCCYLKDTDAVLTYSGAAWVGFDDSNAIQNTIVDAKGDIVAASGSDTPARLAVGNNGETLVANSSTATGLAYKPLDAAGKNAVINGGMDIWQRGTSISVAASTVPYTADRWTLATNANQASTVSRQVVGDATNLPTIGYCARIQRNSGQTGTTQMGFTNNFETVNSLRFAGQTVIISFYARKGADYSPTSSALTVYGISGTGTDQTRAPGTYTNEAYWVNNQTATLTTTWQRFTFSGTVSSTANQLAVYFGMTPTGTAGTNDYFEVTGVQLELGSTATTFSRAGGTIQGELGACQRYYYNYLSGASDLYIGVGALTTNNTVATGIIFPVTMRTTPSLIAASGTNYYRSESAGNASDSFNSFTITRAQTSSAGIFNSSEIASTGGQAAFIYTNNASASIAVSAEL